MPKLMDRIADAVAAAIAPPIAAPSLSPSAPVPAPDETPSRVLSIGDDGTLESHGVDLLGQSRSTARRRRASKDNNDIAQTYAAVFAAIRWREQAITRPVIVLQERRAGEWQDVGESLEPDVHPVLLALAKPNGATTGRQGRGWVERNKLTYGDGVWVKRRDRLGVPREFEFWDGGRTVAIPRKDRPWEPSHFEYFPRNWMMLTGSKPVRVDAKDAVWFRHIVDPTDPMRSLTPIGAIRMQADSSFEAMRAQVNLFDRGLHPGAWLVPEEGSLGPAELERVQQRINEESAGTDEWYAYRLLEAKLRLLADPMSNVDLQFVEMLGWGVIEVARAFEVSPITLKDFSKATYTNADQAGAQDWDTVRNQLDATLDELNTWLVWPDFGKDLRLVARYAGIGALQDSMKTSAEIDEIRLRTGKVTINALRKRDGEEPVAWGDTPIMPSNMVPLGSLQQPADGGAPPPPPPAPGDGEGEGEGDGEAPPGGLEERAVLREALAIIDRTVPEGQRRRAKNELRKAFAR